MQIRGVVLAGIVTISAALFILAVVGVGRFTLVTNDGGMAYRLDKLTGAVWVCVPSGCKALPERPLGLDFDKLSDN